MPPRKNILLFLAAAIFLAVVPRMTAPQFPQLAAVADALAHGLSWGRQSLAASIHCPALSVLLFLPVQAAARLAHLPPAPLYSALCEAAILLSSANILASCRKNPLWAFPPFCILFPLIPVPVDWLPILLLLLAAQNLFLWGIRRHIRNATCAAILCGLLILCGPTWAIIGAMGCLFLSTPHPLNPRPANATLALFPAFWAVALLLLWSWLIVGSPLYRPRMFLRSVRERTVPRPLQTLPAGIPALPELHDAQCIALYGSYLPALFPITQNPGLAASLTYDKNTLRQLASRKTVFLLLPPPEKHLLPLIPELQDIHGRGASWLLLEQMLPDGWELYRVL